jgi:hypothetical protein
VPDDERLTLSDRLGRYFWLIGPIALIAWFAALYFIFGDSL